MLAACSCLRISSSGRGQGLNYLEDVAAIRAVRLLQFEPRLPREVASTKVITLGSRSTFHHVPVISFICNALAASCPCDRAQKNRADAAQILDRFLVPQTQPHPEHAGSPSRSTGTRTNGGTRHTRRNAVSANRAGHMSDADIERKMRIFLLRHADRIVHRGGNMRPLPGGNRMRPGSSLAAAPA